MRSSGTQGAAIVRAGGARVPYAGPIHWGWPRRHITARPWLADTAARTQPTWEATYLAALEHIIDSHRRSTGTMTSPTPLSSLPAPDEEDRTLPGHRMRVSMADGTTYTVRITNRDRVAWDKTAPRHKWGNASGGAVPRLHVPRLVRRLPRRPDRSEVRGVLRRLRRPGRRDRGRRRRPPYPVGSRGYLCVQVARVSRQSLKEIQTFWTDEDLVTMLAVLDEEAAAIEEARR
jgi:hypothetical protein